RYPIGVALTLAPPFVVAHAAAEALFRAAGRADVAPDGYSILYQFVCSAFAMAVGWASLVLIDRLIVLHFRTDGRWVAAGVLCYWVGSNYAYYFFREPFMAHLISAAWVIAAIYMADR